jgi:hypothetical protein
MPDTTTVAAELDTLIADAGQLDRELVALDARCARVLVDADIARLEAQNPHERAAVARFADVGVAW